MRTPLSGKTALAETEKILRTYSAADGRTSIERMREAKPWKAPHVSKVYERAKSKK